MFRKEKALSTLPKSIRLKIRNKTSQLNTGHGTCFLADYNTFVNMDNPRKNKSLSGTTLKIINKKNGKLS